MDDAPELNKSGVIPPPAQRPGPRGIGPISGQPPHLRRPCPPHPDSKQGYCFVFVPPKSKTPKCSIGPTHFQHHAHYEIYKAETIPISLTKLAVEDSPSSITKVPTIIIGMDVSRDGAPFRDSPSIATVVYSRGWPQISEYRAYGCTQSSKLQMDSLYKPEPGCDGKTKDLGIISELLEDFCESSGNTRPEQIIIFRYGFNELQLTQALNAELDLIIKACKLFDENWSPKFVAIKFFEPGGPETVPSAWDLYHRQLDKFITTKPLEYEVVLNEVDLAADDLKKLGDSLSYVHDLSMEAFFLVAPLCYGPKRWQLGEHQTKRLKPKIDHGKVDLGRDREYITDYEELAAYALGRLNANNPGSDYKFKQYLYGQSAYCRADSKSKTNRWQHVSMYAEGVSKGISQKMIVFAELCYSNGGYGHVVHSVLDPNDAAGIRYGCGFCSPCFGGPNPSPHPADPSKFQAGHWPYTMGWYGGFGLLRPPKLED